ncbi:MBOAT family O-acyltransferase [Flavitalea sp. BT771]|uniref:MBOAT family O-acyltransferase n=1 Tax=Flavitalea sp. BT771 TaxID=3063329 RepID=UPI0026E1EDF7|nr:MBOAT family O-acyltransferase [Flavitalea sp. BT771]MDO6429088.1 MBOAT family O-acyltransferase [Flavitalea sp. BT771]MDV6218784.1 MBOAT family O-acyltransferase [Flavitalea sp. BT771]
MLFNSFEFLLFLPVVFTLYWFVFSQSLRWQNILILIASYFFYGWWSIPFMGLLALSTLLDFLYGFQVASPNRKRAKLFLWLSIINNLGILGVFKYYNFFAHQFQEGFELLGLHTNPVLLNVALPIGISFYTFHGMSYVFDIYRQKQKPVSNFVDYAVFVSFFPLLVAGPIERANHLLPQVQKPRAFNYSQALDGCRLMLWGMFKKVVIADSLAETVDKMFNGYQHYNGLSLILGAVAFSFQIYGDFSGYSDIALGTAKLFGFELLSNFRFPYFSRDIAEFWRRWHISLSSWFRDYLYIPLGGSKQGKAKAVRNTFIIFIVSGFWHGASWNFIAWGFIHAVGFLPLLLLDRNRKNVTDVVAQNRRLPGIRELWQMCATFTFVTLAWIFFRADTMSLALNYLKHIGQSIISQPHQLSMLEGKSTFTYIIPIVLGDWWLRRDERKLRMVRSPVIRKLLYWVMAILILSKFSSNSSFIYFQF